MQAIKVLANAVDPHSHITIITFGGRPEDEAGLPSNGNVTADEEATDVLVCYED